jgi:polyisoprenyl-teichoic acid--peptidoglycan teichoic acid transferase
MSRVDITDIRRPSMGKVEQLSFKNDKYSRIKRMLIFCFIVFFCAMVILLGGFAYIYYITPADSHGTIVDSIRFMVEPGKTAFQGKEKMIILCLGVDNNYTEKDIMYTKGARTDTIFLLSIDSKAEAVNMLSLPRDTMVKISDKDGRDKVNAAYAYGGVELAKKCIEEFLGVEIDHYAILKVKSTVNMVNALGGLEIDVVKDMDYDDNWGHLHVHLKKGPQLLNGEQAVGYARYRHDEESDWGRIRRQQQVLNALIKELKKPSNLVRMEKIVKIIHEGVETDMTTAQMLDLARLYKDFDKGAIKTGVIKGDDGVTADGMTYIEPYEAEKIALVKRLLLRDTSLPPSEVKVGVLNGSGTEGQAIELADILSKRGYKVTRVADADRKDYISTKIYDNLDDPKLITSFEEFVGPVEYINNQDGTRENDEDITIIIGDNWKTWKDTKKKENSSSSHDTLAGKKSVKNTALPDPDGPPPVFSTDSEESPGTATEPHSAYARGHKNEKDKDIDAVPTINPTLNQEASPGATKEPEEQNSKVLETPDPGLDEKEPEPQKNGPKAEKSNLNIEYR